MKRGRCVEPFKDDFERELNAESFQSLECFQTNDGWHFVRTRPGSYHGLRIDGQEKLEGCIRATLPQDIVLKRTLYKDRMYTDEEYLQHGWDNFGVETLPLSHKFETLDQLVNQQGELASKLRQYAESGWELDEHIVGDGVYLHVDLDWTTDRNA